MVSHIERQFNKLYTDARIFISMLDLSKLDREKQRKKDSGGIRLEKVKFNMFRRYLQIPLFPGKNLFSTLSHVTLKKKNPCIKKLS